MRRIGKWFPLAASLTVLSALFPVTVLTQPSVTVNASLSENVVYVGESVRLSVNISGDFSNVSRPDLPQFEGFRLLSNIPSTSRSYRFINGKSSTSFTYSYSLIAQDEGSYEIPPVDITIDGRRYSTEPIGVKIVSRNASSSEEDRMPDVFLELSVSDKKPVTGQQVIADVVLFFKEDIEVNSYQPVPGWETRGFWKEELEMPGRPQATSTIVNGIRYRKAQLMKYALFPTKSGTLQLSPYKIIVAVRSERGSDPFSSFFGGFGSNRRRIELESESISLQVQPLPPLEGADYTGAVGDFNISRELSTPSAMVGESVEIITRIKGTGNIPLIPKPRYDLPDGLEVYEPQTSTNLNRGAERISGSKVFTEIVIARSPGSYTIPEKEVAYFDPFRGEYVTETLPALRLEVRRNPEAVTSAENPAILNVSPVTGLATWVNPERRPLTSYWWFWAGLAIPLCLLAAGWWRKSFMDKMATDSNFARAQRAPEKAEERLEKAVALSEAGDIKEAYNMLQKALTGFISDRLALSPAGLSNEDYLKALEEKNIDENLIKNVRLLLEKCASISYAPSSSHEYLKSHAGLARSMLEKLKKVL